MFCRFELERLSTANISLAVMRWGRGWGKVEWSVTGTGKGWIGSGKGEGSVAAVAMGF